MRVAIGLCGVSSRSSCGRSGSSSASTAPTGTGGRGACRAGALVALGASIWLAARRGPHREPTRSHAAAVLGGCAVIGVSAEIAGRWFNDSYSGPPVWPHLLAVAALAGFVAAVVGAARALT